MNADFDVIVIGLGPAGMAVSIMASEMGLKVCGIEKHKVGGECMNVGCIPSKALLRAAKVRHAWKQAGKFGMTSTGEPPLVGDIFKGIAKDLGYISEKKTMGFFQKVHTVIGRGAAEFVDAHTVRVGEDTFTAKKIFIATGTKPEVPAYSGINDIPYLTNENVFSQENVPASMIVIGAGAIACEMAQAFTRLGTQVTVLYRGDRILRQEDADAALLLETAFQREGIKIEYNQSPQAFSKTANGGVRVVTSAGKTIESERVLLALGRRVDFFPMRLERAGVRYEKDHIPVNSRLQTNVSHIYAVGDCNGYYKFSHAAMHQGMIAIMNTLMPSFCGMDFRKYVVPLTIFTEPQISRVGLSETEVRAKYGKSYEVVRVNYADYGAAIAEKIDEGFVKVFVNRTGKILGAVVAGEGSGDMINEWGLAVQKKMRLTDILFLQHSFPSMSFLNKRISEAWMMGLMRKHGWMRQACQTLFKLFS